MQSVSAAHAEPTPPVTVGGTLVSAGVPLSPGGVLVSGVTSPSALGRPVSFPTGGVPVSEFGGMVTSPLEPLSVGSALFFESAAQEANKIRTKTVATFTRRPERISYLIVGKRGAL